MVLGYLFLDLSLQIVLGYSNSGGVSASILYRSIKDVWLSDQRILQTAELIWLFYSYASYRSFENETGWSIFIHAPSTLI